MADKMVQNNWNILVITSDEHNAKIMGCAGHPIIRTPGLDRLASEGTLFTKAYCAYPICAPTRQSFITGQYPLEHGQLSNSHVFDKRNRTWAHHFKQHGYTTACIGKMHTNHESYEYGYDYRYSTEHISEEIKANRKSNPPQFDPADKLIFDSITDIRGEKPSRLHGKVVNDESLETDAIMLKEAVHYLKSHPSEKFFLHVSFVQPHWYWNTSKEYYYMYDPESIDLPKTVPGELESNAVVYKMAEKAGWFHNTEEMHRLARARYYGSISWMDNNVNQLLDTLDELGLTENTLVVYFSDHGDMAGEKGLWLKNQMYDSSARVPLIIRMPGVVPAGEVNDKLINHVDLFPTLAGLTGTQEQMPNDISGVDLSGLIVGGESENALVKSRQFTFSIQGLKSADSVPMQVMARSDRWKFIQYAQEAPDQRYVLYDMNHDPEETRNLASEEQWRPVVHEHLNAIAEFLRGLRKPAYEVIRKEEADVT
ncbi:sulfatase [Paenibacillus allorhizosphaerae]|uniref:Choline-sulfatase n=1 Tax=Paenibacillus allorhizosphaerae TaxID=2849866 RepID=A0ABN7TFJ9_9BACL|nr:sulfatase-like hydrolase/transferase [Paenibacillus allorhizosphaerae]CAG7613954.1 Choline-sulfatase [Paenibacillus allorhizosphaerae]